MTNSLNFHRLLDTIRNAFLCDSLSPSSEVHQTIHIIYLHIPGDDLSKQHTTSFQLKSDDWTLSA